MKNSYRVLGDLTVTQARNVSLLRLEPFPRAAVGSFFFGVFCRVWIWESYKCAKLSKIRPVKRKNNIILWSLDSRIPSAVVMHGDW